MIIHNIQEKYLYVPIGRNAILDPNLKCMDKMYLAVLELYKTNPKYNNLCVKTLESFAEKKVQFKRLKDFGYITENSKAASHKNKWGWTFKISSFDIRQDNCSVIYHHSNGEVSYKRPTSNIVPTALPSDVAKKVPKSLILSCFTDAKLSYNAGGLFMTMMCLSKNKDYSQKDIRLKVNLSESNFNKAWKELKDAGYLKLIQKPNGQHGFNYDYVLYYIPDPDSSSIIILDKNGEIIKKTSFFDVSQDVKKPMYSKTSNNIRNIISSPLVKNRESNKSSNIGIFELELKPILNKIKACYASSSNPELIDTLNKKLLSKYKNKPISLVALVENYKKVLEKHNSSSYKIFDMERYTNTIMLKEFDFAYFKFSIQNYELIRKLLNRPLKSFEKKNKEDNDDKFYFIIDFVDATRNLFRNIIIDDLSYKQRMEFELIRDGSKSCKYCIDIIDTLKAKNPDIENIFASVENERIRVNKKYQEKWLIDTCLPELA